MLTVMKPPVLTRPRRHQRLPSRPLDSKSDYPSNALAAANAHRLSASRHRRRFLIVTRLLREATVNHRKCRRTPKNPPAQRHRCCIRATPRSHSQRHPPALLPVRHSDTFTCLPDTQNRSKCQRSRTGGAFSLKCGKERPPDASFEFRSSVGDSGRVAASYPSRFRFRRKLRKTPGWCRGPSPFVDVIGREDGNNNKPETRKETAMDFLCIIWLISFWL